MSLSFRKQRQVDIRCNISGSGERSPGCQLGEIYLVFGPAPGCPR